MEKKKYGGYDQKIFTQTVNLDFICPICSFVVRQPQECTICGTLFCESCLKKWTENKDDKACDCPMRCKLKSDSNTNVMKPAGKVIRNMLYSLQVKCPKSDCGKTMTLEEYEEHEIQCDLPKCQNIKCLKPTDKFITYIDEPEKTELKFCSEMCKYSYIFQKNLKVMNYDDMTNWFHHLLTEEINLKVHQNCEKRINNLKDMIRAISGNEQFPINELDYSPGVTHFKWDNMKKGQGIQVYNNGESLFLDETNYAFRSIVANRPFHSGVHYFEILADRRTENELKIGITKNINFNYDTSFSDYKFGYAYYGIGQLRHCNNATGEQYGKKFKKSGTLGVFLDMNKGILSFALDGDYFGIAFQSDELKTGPIYAAVSLLHIGGCSLQTGIPVPPYFFSDY